MKYFFLYTELADYTMHCFRVHLETHPEDEIHVVHYPINPEAPFNFSPFDRLFMYQKDKLQDDELHNLVDNVLPGLVVSSGWADRNYNEIADGLAKKGIPVVINFDNVFWPTLKQLIFLPFARILFKKRYRAAWVPGIRQTRFAEKLGFKKENIYTGFYATDTNRFSRMYEKYRHSKEESFPKVFLVVARYIPAKGLEYLWESFLAVKNQTRTDWELWCAGSGSGFENRIQAEGIRHLGFVQPGDFEELIGKAGVFVLPSLFEPWGVAVSEFAAAGMPMLLSNMVGSGEAYLKDGWNGFSFRAGNQGDLREKLKEIIKTDPATLNLWGKRSNELAQKTGALVWSATLKEMTAKYTKSH